jgi:mannosyl-3-phosphoglycerate phosphatase
MAKIVVFTDLDGTLLEEETYSARLSLPALRDLQARDVPIVFCSSKTRAEQEAIRQSLEARDPFIVENGSAIIIPPNTINFTEKCIDESDGTKVLILGKPIAELRGILEEAAYAAGIAYQSFSDLSDEQVAHITGLDLESAQRARAREFSETIVTKFGPSELEVLTRECQLRDLQCAFGGRFLGITARGANKGSAVQVLSKSYRSQFGEVITMGVGDSPNDVSMLRAVDVPYLVQRPDGKWTNLEIADLNYLPAIGPLGFAEMVRCVKQGWLNTA